MVPLKRVTSIRYSPGYLNVNIPLFDTSTGFVSVAKILISQSQRFIPSNLHFFFVAYLAANGIDRKLSATETSETTKLFDMLGLKILKSSRDIVHFPRFLGPYKVKHLTSSEKIPL